MTRCGNTRHSWRLVGTWSARNRPSLWWCRKCGALRARCYPTKGLVTKREKFSYPKVKAP